MAIDKFQEITDRIVTLLEQGVKPWQRPWQSLKCQNLVSGHEYKGWNPLICAIDMSLYGYKSPFFVGVGQAKERGWNIKKGTKSTWIKYFSKFTKEVYNEEESETRSFFTSKWLQVFNIDCLDDSHSEQKIEPLVKAKQPQSSAEERIATIEQFIQFHNPTIGYGGDTACYVPATDKILMPKFEDFSAGEGFYATLLHELIHWTGHESRCNRSLGNGFGTKAYAYEELIAELGSAFLCNKFEINSTIENHASYIESWLSTLKKDKKHLFNAMKDADVAVNFLCK